MTNEPRAPYDFNRILRIDPQENGRNYSNDKEQIARYDVIAHNPRFDPRDKYLANKRFTNPVTVRVWMSRGASASVVYASVWAASRDGETHLAGTGKASGYGYHKESAAICAAMENAGVHFERDFGGCGDGPMQIAVETLAKRLGWKTAQFMRF